MPVQYASDVRYLFWVNHLVPDLPVVFFRSDAFIINSAVLGLFHSDLPAAESLTSDESELLTIDEMQIICNVLNTREELEQSVSNKGVNAGKIVLGPAFAEDPESHLTAKSEWIGFLLGVDESLDSKDYFKQQPAELYFVAMNHANDLHAKRPCDSQSAPLTGNAIENDAVEATPDFEAGETENMAQHADAGEEQFSRSSFHLSWAPCGFSGKSVIIFRTDILSFAEMKVLCDILNKLEVEKYENLRLKEDLRLSGRLDGPSGSVETSDAADRIELGPSFEEDPAAHQIAEAKWEGFFEWVNDYADPREYYHKRRIDLNESARFHANRLCKLREATVRGTSNANRARKGADEGNRQDGEVEQTVSTSDEESIASTDMGNVAKSVTPKGKRPGRPKGTPETIQREESLAERWAYEREQGTRKADFAKDNGTKLKEFDKLLDRVAARKRR